MAAQSDMGWDMCLVLGHAIRKGKWCSVVPGELLEVFLCAGSLMGHTLVTSASPVLWDTTHSWVAYLDISQYISRVRAKG